MSPHLNTAHLKFIKKGSERSVYQHPTDPQQCLKVSHTNLKQRPLKKLLRLAAREAQYLAAAQKQSANLPVSKYYGVLQVEHNGIRLPAYCFQLIRDADGQVSHPITHPQILQTIPPDELLRAADEMFRAIIAANFFCSFHLYNILVQRAHATRNAVKIYIVDDTCRKRLLHPYRAFPFLGRMRIAQKYKAFRQHLIQMIMQTQKQKRTQKPNPRFEKLCQQGIPR